ncbi:BTB domain-containing protein [Caenorhabditis elegans]|uniref:BTB domain-containing protein n=1 Tax=Caenorhabditis elegans TaxID=6239 RepID=P91543_CAEEL|nr:BTB domain-containing protein [Caenorhabditis elegans]CCD63683.1 BTB domain-containing protein [Caenorhabditis elegans]|eukprot:NP_494028.2 BTB (Broad/complex/Tramtrack/Bric a brac) domain protein [Caenorhabditis elegans]
MDWKGKLKFLQFCLLRNNKKKFHFSASYVDNDGQLEIFMDRLKKRLRFGWSCNCESRLNTHHAFYAFQDASRFPQGKYQRHKCARYDLYLVALETPLAEYEKMFSESEDTDAVLVVEDKRLHVNKEFLSLHSTYFAELFKKSEITIEDLSYEDFGLLMSNIYPKVIFPNDFTAEKILELAVRFKVPAAVALVENQLLHHSTLSHGKLLLLADKYEMHRLSGQQVRKIYTKEVAEKLRRSTEYSELSNRARARIGECLLQLF